MVEHEKLIRRLIGDGGIEELGDAFELLRNAEPRIVDSAGEDRAAVTAPDFKLVHGLNVELRSAAAKLVKEGNAEAVDLYRRSLLFDAPHDLDAYILYLEWDRPWENKFYEPRRKQLRPVVKEIQRLADDELDILGISEPPGVGKTTLAMFACTWFGGRDPDKTILMGSHSNSLLGGVYGEMLRVVSPGSEYLFSDVFPGSPLTKTDAKNMRLNLGTPKRFDTFEFASIGSGNAGRVRATGLLYCDDLVDGIETAMSKDRLDKLWTQYTVDYRQRKLGKAKELHIATRWSIHDVVGRLEEMYSGNPRAKFIRFPALDENDESNFDYPNGLGYSTEVLHEQRMIMSDVEWKALYMNEPIEREGRLYDPDELRRYFALPEDEPDAIIGVVDTKEQGSDYCVMPVAYVYGNDYYIDSFVCDNGKPEIVEAKIIDRIVARKMERVEIESNRGGTLFAANVKKGIDEAGAACTVTTKWNQTNKETRILVASGWIKEHCLFKDDSVFGEDREYRNAMMMLCGYSMVGKNKNDDVPDAMSTLYDFVRNMKGNRVEILKRLW